VFRALSNLARTFYLQGRYEKAEPLYLRCLKVAETSLAPTDPDVVATLSKYAELLRKLHRKSEARKIEARVRELHAKSDVGNPARFEVDWRDLPKRGN
ncbi:MAG: Tfp pilus assembly protein PilF, partial [Bryobacterales bacterium]|nr:Tfp pilus assembly protein PilF [Bryobacterales bacterium]